MEQHPTGFQLGGPALESHLERYQSGRDLQTARSRYRDVGQANEIDRRARARDQLNFDSLREIVNMRSRFSVSLVPSAAQSTRGVHTLNQLAQDLRFETSKTTKIG